MDCNFFNLQWPADELLMKYQYISDFFIAVAYFSIPIELVYFVQKSAVLPYRWVLMQFGAFIVLGGATHLISLWTSTAHTRTVAIVMTTAKVFTAVVSCATALMLVHIIPDLLSVKTRELFLKNRGAELDSEIGLIRTQEETGRYVRMLTHEIRSTLDRHTILKTTLVELGKALALEECALWMPTRTGLELQPSYTLHHQNPESMRARDLLMEQNVAIDLARREAETAVRAHNDFLAVMNHEMRTPMHAINALSSLLQESKLAPEQRLMQERILKSNNLLAMFINNVLDLSRLEDGSLKLGVGTFNLHALFREVLNLIKPIASVKKLFVTFSLSLDLPEVAAEDEKRLILLNVVGNAVKFSKEGSVSISAIAVKSKSLTDPRAARVFSVQSQNHFYLRVQAPATKNSGGTGLGLAICKSFSRMVAKSLLVHLGCDVTTVGSGDECLRVLTQELKVVFMDVSMPGINCYDVAVSVHEKFGKRRERPLIVALTGNTDLVTKENCTRVGMDGVILKPVLVDKIRCSSELLKHGAVLQSL
ncbi:unnamed protein product [Withania somnifera]